MDKENVGLLHGGLFRHTKEGNNAISNSVDELGKTTLSEIQAEKGKHCRISLMWNLMRGLGKPASYKQSRKVVPRHWQVGEMGVILVKRNKLTVKSSRDLMYSIGIMLTTYCVH